MTDLKPCPFCGHANVQVHEKRRGNYKRVGDNYQVWCAKCKARGPLVKDTPAKAEATWNSRVAENKPDNLRTCTCHPSDNPPVPCSAQYALSECKKTELIKQLRSEAEYLQRNREACLSDLLDEAADALESQ